MFYLFTNYSSYHLPTCLGPPMLFNLPICNWTFLGSECLQSTNNSNNNNKYQKSFHSTIPSTSNNNTTNTNTNSNHNMNLNYENIKNCYSINKDVMNFNGIFTPKNYITFISDSKFNDTIDLAQNTKLIETSNHLQNNDNINDNNNNKDSLYLLSSNYSSDVSYINFSDIFTLMRSNFIMNIDNSNNIHHIILSDLQDWPFNGILDVEPLKFPLDKLSIQLNDDCDIECVDFCMFVFFVGLFSLHFLEFK